MATVLDLESNEQYLSGYPSLAAFIASDRDRTTLIFKRFDELAARNLLYLQSELAELQRKQRAFDEEDVKADMATKQCARNYSDFRKAATQDGNPKQKERLELAYRVRHTLKEYRKALLFESTLASLPPPSKHVLRAFRTEFFNESPNMSESFPTLGGDSASLYDNIDDLVALGVQEKQDRLTSFTQEHLGSLFLDRSHFRQGIAYTSDRAIGTFIAWFSTLLAALLLIGAIVVLYKVQSLNWRLGWIGAFTSLFAGSVGLLTNARRAEIFGATAAYAAVLVVFVSGNLVSTPTSGAG